MRPVEYQKLIEGVRDAGAALDVDGGRLMLVGDVPEALRKLLWKHEAELVALLQTESGEVDVRTAALELWEWLEAGRLKGVWQAVVIQPGVTVLPGRIEFAVRQELQMAKGKSHRAMISRQFLKALHAGIAPHVRSRDRRHRR